MVTIISAVIAFACLIGLRVIMSNLQKEISELRSQLSKANLVIAQQRQEINALNERASKERRDRILAPLSNNLTTLTNRSGYEKSAQALKDQEKQEKKIADIGPANTWDYNTYLAQQQASVVMGLSTESSERNNISGGAFGGNVTSIDYSNSSNSCDSSSSDTGSSSSSDSDSCGGSGD